MNVMEEALEEPKINDEKIKCTLEQFAAYISQKIHYGIYHSFDVTIDKDYFEREFYREYKKAEKDFVVTNVTGILANSAFVELVKQFVLDYLQPFFKLGMKAKEAFND